MREMPCLWQDCDAVLNSAETLAQHAVLHALHVEPRTDSEVDGILLEHSGKETNRPPSHYCIHAYG